MSAVNIPVLVHVKLAGAMTTGTNKAKLQMPVDGRVVSATATLLTGNVGAAFIIDINSGGTSIFAAAGDRVTIADGATSSGVTPATAVEATRDFVEGAILSVDIDQIGSGTAGSDLSLVIAIEGDTNPGN